MSTPIVLAFSGGLDTSFCVLDLIEQGFDVHSVFVDTGGLDAERRQWIADRAESLGVTQHHELEAGQSLWDEFVKPLVWCQGRVLDAYPMLCSDRYMIVNKCLQLADELGTEHFAHGCTGMGNDQLRFDQTVRSLGDYTIHAPIRELQKKTTQVRDHELAVLEKAGISVPDEASRYSINENLLGTTISGSEIDRFEAPGEDTYRLSRPAEEWPEQPLEMTISFDQGVATHLNGEALAGPELLQQLNQAFGAFGVGRHLYTGDVSIGLKGRILFECPGVDALLTAHKALEDAVNTRLQNQFRHVIAARWSELVYTGFFHEPHKRDLEAYLQSSQKSVSGTVTLRTHGGTVLATAIESDWLLTDPDAVYAQTCTWTPEEAEGFVKLIGQSSTMAARIERRQRGGS